MATAPHALYFKACPRCHGDVELRLEPGHDWIVLNCLQCGWYVDLSRAAVGEV